MKRNCPAMTPEKESQGVNMGNYASPSPASPNVSSWSLSVMAAAMSSRSMSVVRIQGANTQGIAEVSALLDSGADLSLCRRSFANKLREDGMIIREDWHKGAAPELQLADGTTLNPVGLLDLVVEGSKTQVVVLDSLCTDFIVGKDLMRKVDLLLVKLVAAVKECSMEEAKLVCRVAMSEPLEEVCAAQSVEHLNVEVEQPAHCVRDPAVLKWKEGAREALPCNIKGALGEARSLEARLRRNNPVLLASYEEILQDWESKKWLAETDISRVKYCLRHFPVARDPNGATAMKRCRIVVAGSQLTPLLDVDECSHRDMLSILLRWRTCLRFVCLDISQAYMRIQISEADSYYLCIAWKGRCLRFRSLPMGISPSASILQETVDRYIAEWERGFVVPECYYKVAPYMDDLLTLIWNKSGMLGNVDLRKVEGDARESLTKFLKEKRLDVSESKTITTEGAGMQLGVPFSKGRIGITANKVTAMKKSEVPVDITRSRAAGWLGTLFDPLGLVAELSVQARLIASSFSGIPWKHPLPKHLATETLKWTDKVMLALKVSEPRQVFLFSKSRLYVFTDASQVAYGVVIVGQDAEGKCCRVYARGKVYKKHQKLWCRSSSKIELLALKFGVSMVQYLRKAWSDIAEWKDAEFIFGMDNETNCDRLSRDSAEDITDKWERNTLVEVSNAIANLGSWVYHVPGGANPSDEVSRGSWDLGSGLSKMTEAVNWFSEDRAFRPKKMCRPIVSVESGEESESALSDPALVAVTAPRMAVQPPEEVRNTVGLTERYVEEAGDKSRVQWLLEYQLADRDLEKFFAAGKLKMHNGVLVSVGRQDLDGTVCNAVAIPKALRANALVTIHEGSGHFGTRKCVIRARDLFWWKGMGTEIRRHCNRCSVCQQIKGNRIWSTGPGALAVKPRPWHVVGIDTLRGLSQPVLTVTCLYTKYTFAMAIPNEGSKAICDALNRIFLAEGGPALVISDNAQAMTSREMAAFLNKWNATARTIPRYAPWYGGWYEVGHRTLTKTLAALVIEAETNKWKTKLLEAVYYYNTRPYEYETDVGLSPHEVFRGRRLVNQWIPEENIEIPIGESKVFSAEILKERELIGAQFEEVWRCMRESVRKEIERRQKGTERYEVGDFVYVWVPSEIRGKLDARWNGPYRVDKVLSPVLYQVGNKVEHNLNLKRAKFEPGSDVDMRDVSGLPLAPPMKIALDANFGTNPDLEKVDCGLGTDNRDRSDAAVGSDGIPKMDKGTGDSLIKSGINSGTNPESKFVSKGTQDVRNFVHRAVPEDDVESNVFENERLGGKRRIMTRSQTGRGGKQPKLSAVLAMVLAYQPKGDLLWL
jgi:hypothetical protein